MRGDGCGGHGKEKGVWVHRDDCEMCARWDWSPEPARAIDVVAKRLARTFLPTGQAYLYDEEKAMWRTSVGVISALRYAGLIVVVAPPCGTCSLPVNDSVHYDVRGPGGVPVTPNQHPYVP